MLSPAVLGLLVLGLCVVLFLTNPFPLCVTGLLGCVLMVLLGVVPLQTAISGFGNSIVLLMAGAMIVGIAMFRTGVAQLIGGAAVRLSRGKERRFLFASCVLGAALSMFFANTAIIATFIPIIDSICRSSKTMKRRNLLLPITCAIMIGGAGTLVGCTPQLTANAMMTEMVGEGLDMWTLTGPMVGMFVMYMVYIMLFGHRSGERIWGARPEHSMHAEPDDEIPEEQAQVPKRKRITMYVILVLMIVLYITELIPITLTALLAALLCLMTGCCSVGDVRRELHWESIIFLATCLSLAQCLTEAGSGDLIGSAVNAVLGNASSPFVVFAAVVALTLVLSQFITNSTAIIIAMPIGLSLCSLYGFSNVAFCVGITLAASVACCTPLAASQITMTQVAGYEFSDYLKFCALPTLVMYAAILIFVPLFYPLAA